MAARHPVDQRLCPSLYRITACFTETFAAIDIALDFVIAETFEPDDAVANPAAHPALGIDDRNGAQHMVPSATQQLKKAALHFSIGSLWQNPASDSDGRIARHHNFTRIARHGNGLFFGHPQRIYARHFAFAWIFINVGRCHSIGDQTKTRQQVPPTRAGGCQNKFGVQTQGLRRLI